MEEIVPGLLFISDPFLKDPNFARTVVLICEHQFEGSLGFVLNKPYTQPLEEFIADLDGFEFPLYYGGPVQIDTVQFLHCRPDLIEDSLEIYDGIYWGGDFDVALDLIKTKQITETDIRFFIGYSGWSEGQLAEELSAKSWITRNSTKKLVFKKQADLIWKEALKDLGGEYSQMVNYPVDPQLN